MAEVSRGVGASPRALRSKSPSKGALEGVKGLSPKLDPLNKVQVTTPGTVKISLKSGSVL